MSSPPSLPPTFLQIKKERERERERERAEQRPKVCTEVVAELQRYRGFRFRPSANGRTEEVRKYPHPPVQIEGKDWLLDQALLHHVAEHSGDIVNRDALESHPENAIKLASDKRSSGNVGALSKSLVLDTVASNLARMERNAIKGSCCGKWNKPKIWRKYLCPVSTITQEKHTHSTQRANVKHSTWVKTTTQPQSGWTHLVTLLPVVLHLSFGQNQSLVWSTHRDCVDTEETRERASSVLNGEACSIRLVCAWLAAVVLVVQSCPRKHNRISWSIDQSNFSHFSLFFFTCNWKKNKNFCSSLLSLKIKNKRTTVRIYNQQTPAKQRRRDLPQARSLFGHFDDGTHRLEDPVSKITLKVWGGVPIVIGPKYSACTHEHTPSISGWKTREDIDSDTTKVSDFTQDTK